VKLRQLRYFAKIVETGNITRAAEQLNLAQTALGIQIRNLEESLNVELLDRHSRGVRPTRAGKLLYERSLEILRRIDETRQDIASLSGERVPLRFGATPSILKLIGSDIIVAARNELPDIALHVVEELSFVLVDALNRGELDYVLAYDVGDGPGLRRQALVEEDLLYISAPTGEPHADEISFRRAVQGDLALVSDRDFIWKAVHETAARLSINVKPTYHVQSMQGIKTLIQHGLAQSIMPYGIVAEQIASGELVARRIVQPSVRLTLFLSSAAHKRHLADEEPFLAFVDRMVARLLAKLGAHAQPIDRLPRD
jgi:LysR family nitrogen assimilation transcriptional regulator